MTEGALLSARAQALTLALEEFKALKSVAHSLRELQQRRDQLLKELARLRPAIGLLAAARTRVPHLRFIPAGEVGKAHDMLATLSAAFVTDPQAIVGTEFGTTLQAARKAVLAVEEHARAVWAELAVPVRDEIKGELLDALSRVPAWRNTVTRIQGLQTTLARLAALPLVSPEQFDEFFRTSEERNSAWQGLQGDGGIPASVVEFLRACAKEGMPLDALSDEVIDWLRERKIVQFFRVRL